jgi:hypothetical protein
MVYIFCILYVSQIALASADLSPTKAESKEFHRYLFMFLLFYIFVLTDENIFLHLVYLYAKGAFFLWNNGRPLKNHIHNNTLSNLHSSRAFSAVAFSVPSLSSRPPGPLEAFSDSEKRDNRVRRSASDPDALWSDCNSLSTLARSVLTMCCQ